MIFCSYLLTNGEDRDGVKPVTVFFVAKTLQDKIKRARTIYWLIRYWDLFEKC